MSSPNSMLRAIFFAAAISAAMAVFIVPSFAGGGHDHAHADSGAAQTVATAPRFALMSDVFEIVGIVKGDDLVLYLDRADDNAPVQNARIDVTLDGVVFPATQRPDGAYGVTTPDLKKQGQREIIVEIKTDAASDLLVGSITVPASDSNSATPQIGGLAGVKAKLHDVRDNLFILVSTLGLGLLVGALYQTRPKLAGGVLLALILALLSSSAFAQEDHGHDHSPAATAPSGDAPHRRPDGSVFLPKPSQRLLDIRTGVTQSEEVRRTLHFAGRILADPNRSGQVQGTIGGRVVAAPGGFPHLGQKVRAGELLASIQPSFLSIDAATLQQTDSDLEQQIILHQSRLERQKVLVDRNAIARQTIEETQLQLQGLERRRAEIARSRAQAEPLVAPVDGVIAAMRVVAGQVVSPSDILFQIIDPRSLWVEALVFDQVDPAAITDAKAQLPGESIIPLTLIGRSRTLQQQSTLLHFQMTAPPPDLSVGTPVSVTVATGAPVKALLAPKASLVRAANGQMIVFQHKEPEIFVPRPVRWEEFDSERAMILSGLEAGERIVVRNALLINQIR